MKKHIYLAVVRLLSAAICGTALSALAAVPVRWTAETSRVQPIALDAWRGDTLALECTLKSYGQPVALGAATASLMWQTNGMGNAWWQTNATVSADGIITATWSPSMDPGAPAVAFFLPVQTAGGASYRAAGTLRFRPSPGADSQIADLPQPGGTLDFGAFQLVNAPWATLEAANEAIAAAVASATGALVIPPAVDLTPYATTGDLQTASTSLANDIQLAFNASSNYTDQVASGLSSSITSATNSLSSVLRDTISESAAASRSYADSAASNAQANAEAAASNYTDQVSATLSATISSSTNSLGSVLRDTIAESAAASRTYADGVALNAQAYADGVASNAQRAAMAAIPSLSGYATEQYVSDAISAIDIPSMSGYATMAYADAVASNAQRSAIAAIPSLSGYATEQYVANYVASNNTPIDLSSYASRAYADAAASNAQAAAIAAIPSLAGYATETYAQNAASDAASDALSAAQSYARDLSWGASAGNTRLVTLDGTTWQDATGTVWQTSEIYGWSGTVIDLSTSAARPITFLYAGKTDPPISVDEEYFTAGGGTNLFYGSNMGYTWILWFTNSYYEAESNSLWFASGDPPLSATNITITTSNEYYSLFYRPVALATNPVDHVLYASASGDAATADRALSVGTSNYWIDATGCVWQVENSIGGWMSTTSAVQFTSWNEVDPEADLWKIFFNVDGAGANGYAPNPTGNTSYTLEAGTWLYDETDDYGDFDVTFVRPTIPGGLTNLVGRVALTNDLPGAIISTISDFASTGTVHAAESSTYSSRLFDASYDSAYDATYLIRESTNAATAVSSSLVRYALVTPGEWEFSGVPGELTVVSIYFDDGVGDWNMIMSNDAVATTEGDGSELSVVFSGFSYGGTYTITATRSSLPGKLIDRAVNSLSITSPTNITLPALSHPGQARDFILLLDIPSSVTNTVPGLTGLLTFTPSDSETVHYYVDADDPSSAEFPVPTSPGTWSYSFSEFKASWFAVSLKPIVEAAAPGGAQ
jgi:epidermal growth factor receptor substrate 15